MFEPPEEVPGGRAASDRFRNDLIGLDPNDPQAQEFAAHLDRMERVRPTYTIEGSLDGIGDLADSANRLGGHYRLMATVVAVLILFGVALGAWHTIRYVIAVIF